MATTSEVKAGLDDIAGIIRIQRAVVRKAIANSAGASAILAAIQADHADVIATIDGYSVATTDEFERLAKAEKAKLQSEFTALKSDADTIAAVNLAS